MQDQDSPSSTHHFRREVTERFGVLPNFFCSADAAPGLIEELWKFARSAYLDSPLPSLFKERLFVHLSRFCRVRYCIVRHVGFLIGQGRPAGDAAAAPETIDCVVEMLRRPVPSGSSLAEVLERLERSYPTGRLPDPRTQDESDLFDALTIMFLSPRAAARASAAVRTAVGAATFELLVAYLAFIRTAHYWTEMHPELTFESDMQETMRAHAGLAALLLDTSEAELLQDGLEFRDTLQSLERTAAELRDREADLAQIERASGVASVNVDIANGLRGYRSAQYRRLHGLPSYVVTEAHDDWLARVHPADRERADRTLHEALAGPSLQYRSEYRIIRPNDGEERWILATGDIERDAAGAPTRLIGAHIDITERKRHEEALRRSEEQLREADQRKDEFLAMLAHELRNPLAPIRTGLELIRVAGDTPDAVERVRSLMERQVGHMVRLIDDLLDVSRITSGRIQLRREPTPLSSLVNNAVDANRAAISEKQIQLHVEIPESRCVLDVDPTRLIQVISNLLHNATKFTDSGGSIRLSASIGDSENRSPELTLSVKDSGIGIAPELLPRVFDLFAQGEQASSQTGLGIGLALAYRLVKMHGGQITAHSEGLGLGSEFVIRLPLSTQMPHAQPAEAVRPKAIHCSVIVIDDNRDAANAMTMLVEELGGECKTAYDGESGLRAVLSHRPDVVLLDIGMSSMDGYETCRRIRSMAGDDLIVVALTGFGQEEDKDNATRAGFSAHLTKPADPATLAKLLQQCSSGN